MTEEDSTLQKNVRRTVGIRALREIRRLVDDIEQQDASNRYAARWIVVLVVVIAVIGLALLFLPRL